MCFSGFQDNSLNAQCNVLYTLLYNFFSSWKPFGMYIYYLAYYMDLGFTSLRVSFFDFDIFMLWVDVFIFNDDTQFLLNNWQIFQTLFRFILDNLVLVKIQKYFQKFGLRETFFFLFRCRMCNIWESDRFIQCTTQVYYISSC